MDLCGDLVELLVRWCWRIRLAWLNDFVIRIGVWGRQFSASSPRSRLFSERRHISLTRPTVVLTQTISKRFWLVKLSLIQLGFTWWISASNSNAYPSPLRQQSIRPVPNTLTRLPRQLVVFHIHFVVLVFVFVWMFSVLWRQLLLNSIYCLMNKSRLWKKKLYCKILFKMKMKRK